MEESQATRNLRDYLTMYNIFTQKCFNTCVTNLNYRFLTHEEHSCVQKCANKLININHRLITVYMEINPMNKYKEQQEKAIKEMEAKQLEEAQRQASLQAEVQPTDQASEATHQLPQSTDQASVSTDQVPQSGLAKQVGETFKGVEITNSSSANHTSNVNGQVNKTVESTGEVK